VLLKLKSWFSAFNFMKNIKYACDRKFTGVYACQELSKQTMANKVIAKIKWRSFLI